MNQKIQSLIDGGFITIADVMEYAEQHNLNEMDKYYEERLDQLHQDVMDEERRLHDEMMQSQDDERLMMSYWECGEGTLHLHNEECNCEEYRMQFLDDLYKNTEPEYDDDYEEEDRMPEKAESPEYIIASVSERLMETYVFESDAEGTITNWAEYGGLAYRWGCDNWRNHQDAVRCAMGDSQYRLERRIPTETGVSHYLYSKVNPADYWNGESVAE